jgi:Ca2+-binding RTX toxin-like protein
MTIGQDVINASSGGNLYFTGGTGTDTFNVDASANTGATNLRVINFRVEMSGSARQGQFSSKPSRRTSSAAPAAMCSPSTRSITARRLAISGNNGNDVARFTPTSGDLSTNVTSIAAFDFNGGNNSDALVLFNHNTTGSWNYYPQQHCPAGAESRERLHTVPGQYQHRNRLRPQRRAVRPVLRRERPERIADPAQWRKRAGLLLHGQLAQNSQNILGAVEVSDGGATDQDSIIVDNRSDTVGRTVHVTDSASEPSQATRCLVPAGR